MNNKFSIVIPAYNCEKTIEKCLDSVLSQNYKEYEIVIVNDGSTDSTADILKKYLKNKKIKVFNQKNSGVSDARNTGIKKSSNDWILFLDSDDWIELNSLSDLNDLINKYDPDYIITRLIYSNRKKENVISYIVDDKKNIVDNIVCVEYSDRKYNDQYQNSRCIGGKLIKKSLVDKNSISFPSGIRKCEDGIFNLQAIHASKKPLYTTYQFYNYYYDNPSSRSNTFNEKEVNGNIEVFKNINKLLNEYNIETDSINYLSFFLFIASVDNIMHLDCSKDEKIKKIKKNKNIYYEYYKNTKYNYLDFNKKIELFFSKMKGINLLYCLYNFKAKILKK